MQIEEKANEYGTAFAIYSGNGTLTDNNRNSVSCSFCAFQLLDGQVILLCDIDHINFEMNYESATNFIGQTEDNQTINAIGLEEINYLPELPCGKIGTYAAYLVRKLSVKTSSVETVAICRFVITNLILINHELNIEHPLGQAKLRLVANYNRIAERIRTIKSIDITVELEFNGQDFETFGQIADDFCYLLSLARGTKIQWVCRDDYSSSGTRVSRSHFNRITKPYCSLAVIDPQELNDTPNFLSNTITTYVERRDEWKLAKGLIDAYLNAKSEDDFLEMRAVKMAVAMEMIKDSFIEVSAYSDLIKPEDEFRRMIPDIKKALKEALNNCLESEERASIYENINGLNRKPFRHLIEALCSYLDIPILDDDFKLFVRCRNSLVHKGRFYCDTADEKERSSVQPHDNAVKEYFWLMHFLDRIFLRLVGYRGPYIDYSEPGNPQRRLTF